VSISEEYAASPSFPCLWSFPGFVVHTFSIVLDERGLTSSLFSPRSFAAAALSLTFRVDRSVHPPRLDPLPYKFDGHAVAQLTPSVFSTSFSSLRPFLLAITPALFLPLSAPRKWVPPLVRDRDGDRRARQVLFLPSPFAPPECRETLLGPACCLLGPTFSFVLQVRSVLCFFFPFFRLLNRSFVSSRRPPAVPPPQSCPVLFSPTGFSAPFIFRGTRSFGRYVNRFHQRLKHKDPPLPPIPRHRSEKRSVQSFLRM